MSAASTTILIPHIDDVACSHGANEAMIRLADARTVTSGSVMVPPAWFPEIAEHPATPELDLGVHLTLTSESRAFRWRPLSTSSKASGLLDADGYLWPTVLDLRAGASPEAVEAELRAQIDAALAAGIDVTHVDHHMGAALAPEFVEGTCRIAIEYQLPILFPADLDSYLGVLSMGPVDGAVLADARATLGSLAVADHFRMPLIHQDEADVAGIIRRELADLEPGVTYLSLHCATAGEIAAIHPNDARWRIGEYETFASDEFAEWLSFAPFELRGLREHRELVRGG